MSNFIKNLRLNTRNRLPDNAPLKYVERNLLVPYTPDEAKEQWVKNQEAYDAYLGESINERARDAYYSSKNGSLIDTTDIDPSYNLIYKDSGLIKNKDNLINFLDSLKEQPTWNDKMSAIRNASMQMGTTDGLKAWFDFLGKEVDEMRYQEEEEGTTIDPSYFLDSVKRTLKNAGPKINLS